MYKIKILRKAENNLIETFNYISLDNTNYAKIVLDSIKKSINYLSKYPFLWKKIDDNLRQIVEPKYKFKIIYKVSKNIIYIVAVFKNKNSWE